MKKNKKNTFIFALFPQKEWLPCFGKAPKQESHLLSIKSLKYFLIRNNKPSQSAMR